MTGQLHANWKRWAKVLGLIFLFAYFWHYPPQIEWMWVAAYLGLAIGVGFLFTLLINPIIDRFLPNQRIDLELIGLRRIEQAKRHPWMEALLLPGEDGLFFVPLLLVGANWLSTGITALLYGGMHYPEFPPKLCLVKAALICLVAVLILPHGLGTVVVGHLVLDTLGYLVWRWSPSPLRSTSADDS